MRVANASRYPDEGRALFSTLSIVLPIFGLILAGWVARRTGALGEHAARELNRFVVYLALPCLLFDIVANADWTEIWQPGFIAAFGLGGLFTFALVLVVRLKGRSLSDAAIDGLNGAYANTAYVGFPLTLAALGPGSQTPTLIASILTVTLLFALTVVLIEVSLQAKGDGKTIALGLAKSLGRNPLLVAPALGAVVMALGLDIPAPAESFLKLLGVAAPPCALVGLGLFLAADRPPETQRHGGAIAFLVGAKLVVQPVLTWALAVFVLKLPTALVHTAVLLAALPTGTGPYMVAEFYGRDAGVTAKVILISTILAVLTVSAYLVVIA